MKKINKFIACICVFVITLSFCSVAFADYQDEPYYFESYDVSINVLENNAFEITENISAFFNSERHGIYRTIPLKNRIERADGTKATVRAKVKDVRVSENYITDKSLSEYTIQIGDENKTILGKHNYTISYTYVLSKDTAVGYDELYYNIIGDQWDTYIENVTFSITMPKEFDESLVGFSSGEYGQVGTDSIDYQVKGNRIYGSLNKTLSPYNAFTIRVQLPENYFEFNAVSYYASLALMIIVALAGIIIVFTLWRKFGKDKKIIDVVEFYPPENMSSADVAYWYKGNIQNTDLVPLMIELANEGYIEINEIGKSSRKKSGDFEIKILSHYTGPDENKKTFFDGLVHCSSDNVVTKWDLKNSFYAYLDTICAHYNTRKNRKKIFSQKSLYMRLLGWLISLICSVLDIFIAFTLLDSGKKYIVLLIALLINLISFIISFFIRKRTDEGHRILQHLTGFKKFLKTAEKQRLEALVYDDPEYFYNILPYAYVLGVSDEYIKNFESIAIEPAHWYNCRSSSFNYWMFYHFMNSTIQSSTKSMTSQPQSSGGSFSSGGGGFSGGGVGGGGGGSW